MYNMGNIRFKDISGKAGCLVPIESKRNIPFDIKRIYYITQVPNEIRRGFHSHRQLHQVLLCLNGSVKIKLKDGNEELVVELNNCSEGLYIGPMIWREMYDFTEGCVLLVMASEYYDEKDYIRDYEEYLKEAKQFFGTK